MKQSDQEPWEYYGDRGDATKKNRQQQRRRISLIIMLLSFLCLALLGVFNHKTAEQDPAFCANCHEMKASYTAWQNSAHGKVDCLSCHQDVSIAGDLYKQLLGVDRIGKIQVAVASSACESCHSNTRTITPPEDLTIPHTLHLQVGVDCTRCHGNIMKDIGGPAATTVTATNQSGQPVQVSNSISAQGTTMDACMTCHNGAMATNTCNACHDDKTPPASHTTANFATSHGYVAVGNTASCNSCHQYNAALQQQYKPQGDGWQATQSFARQTDFCSSCHQKRPTSHGKIYILSHGAAAKGNINACLTCHNYDDKGKVKEKPAAAITCSQCHYNTLPH